MEYGLEGVWFRWSIVKMEYGLDGVGFRWSRV
mgnify:FL=1